MKLKSVSKLSRLMKFGLIIQLIMIATLSLQSCDDDNEEVSIPTPTISGITPSEGAPGTLVTIAGANLDGGTVTLSGSAVSTSSVTSTQIQFTVPEGAVTGMVVVTTEGGTAESATAFTVLENAAEPTITSFSPSEGFPGSELTIDGTDLAGVSAITVNGASVDVSSLFLNSEVRIILNVPMDAPIGSGKISVTTAGGTAESADSYTVLDPLPQIATLVPAEGFAGENIKIQGINLTDATAVEFSGAGDTKVAATIVNNSESEIEVTIPEGAVTGKIFVTTAFGVGESASDFTIKLPVPDFSAFVDKKNRFERNWVERGDTIIIAGTFLSTVIEVTLDGSAVNIIEIEADTAIQVEIPQSATSGLLEITAPGGSVTTDFDLEVVNLFVMSWYDGVGEASPTGPIWVTQDSRETWLSGEVVKNDETNDIVTPRFDLEGSDGYIETFRSASPSDDENYLGPPRHGSVDAPFFAQFPSDYLTSVTFRVRARSAKDGESFRCFTSTYKGATRLQLTDNFSEYAWPMSDFVDASDNAIDINSISDMGVEVWGAAAATNGGGGVFIDYMLFTQRID
ncbi:MAG: IPT/TIG domain-containing protein [Bacteroidota bacterium]